jgi:hypothetical protein
MATVLRLYSYLFHFILGLFLLAVSGLAMTSNSTTFSVDVFPWKGSQGATYLFWASLVGVVSVVLAITGMFKYLFPLWALAVLGVMIWGFILQGSYYFGGTDALYTALLMIFAALLAFFGALSVLRSKRTRR